MDIYSKIKNMKIQGASEIAIKELLYLKDFAEKHGFSQKFEKECKRLMNIRKTAVVSHNVISIILRDKSLEKITDLIEELKEVRKKIANNSKDLFSNGKKTIMTHCHSHEATQVMLYNRKMIKEVYVTETRPFNQGLMTANDLAGRVDVKYVVDSAEGFFMPKVDFILIGADALRREGLVNKIGTLQLCILAKAYGKKVFVAADVFKLDNRKKIDIEYRSAEEITKYLDRKQIVSLRSVKILNPIFDITPWKYITAVITEKGVLKPEKLFKNS